jgi:anti-sigma regulatory factor (Ser/Thr protein kinase)/biotin operon repressor
MIREKILRQFQKKQHLRTADLVRTFGISRQAVQRHLQILLREGKIIQRGTSRKTSSYLLNNPALLRKEREGLKSFHKRFKREGLAEETVLKEVELRTSLLSILSAESRTLFHYGFTEILNNPIDHSESESVDVAVQADTSHIYFAITDHGVGIFENIRTKQGLKNEMEAIQDLLKGKETTLPSRHSGEGIFFTSKAADRLVLESHGKRVVVDSRLEDLFVEDIRWRTGTRVSFELARRSVKKLADIFRAYTNEEFQFSKTRVTVKLFQKGEEYISRSQAKRILHALDRFQEVTLDFKGISTIGQGFADEVFRVYHLSHPAIKMTPINCHENVQFMINWAQQV